jgi:hypothetical protein
LFIWKAPLPVLLALVLALVLPSTRAEAQNSDLLLNMRPLSEAELDEYRRLEHVAREVEFEEAAIASAVFQIEGSSLFGVAKSFLRRTLAERLSDAPQRFLVALFSADSDSLRGLAIAAIGAVTSELEADSAVALVGIVEDADRGNEERAALVRCAGSRSRLALATCSSGGRTGLGSGRCPRLVVGSLY